MSNIENEDEKNHNVSIIMGDPKLAIKKLSLPIMVSMLVTFAYNLADTIWVAGLGTEALAALGFFMPIFLIIIGLGNGLGSGANSLISRSIGEKNKKKADNAAIHAILLTVFISIVAPVILLFFLKDILTIMGAGSVTPFVVEYAQIILVGLIALLFSSVGASILRSEGDVNRAMYVMLVTAILNIIIDPIFIYVLNLGISGAAIATIISSSISSLIICYWLIIKKNTYLSISFKNFRFNLTILKNIIGVAIPATSETVIFSIISLIINFMLSLLSGPMGVATYTAGWRIVNLAMIPHLGLSTATLTVVGAAYGARKIKKLISAYNYSIKLGLSISSVMGILIFLFAPYISMIFAYSNQASLAPAITNFLRIISIFCITLPFGTISSATFQGLGKGLISLILAIQRVLIFEAIFAWFFAFVLNMGVYGVFWGLSLGGVVGYLIAYASTKFYTKGLDKIYKPKKHS